MIKNNAIKKLITADPIKLKHANYHLGETTKKIARDETIAAIDDKILIMSVSSSVISTTYTNLQKEKDK